jgi:RNA polymerase sigma factor (sigma-70 family)
MQNAAKPRGVPGSEDFGSDAELMALIGRGDRDAFAALVRRHQRPLLGLFRRLGIDAHAAEDCAQETFLRVFRSSARYRPIAPFPAFLYRLARQSWVDWGRRESRRGRCAERADLAGLPAEPAGSIDDRLDLEAALRTLPEHLKWVVLLAVEAGLAHAEIGAVLELPVGTVKSRMFHAVRRLRRALHAVPEGR